ncbi:MAG TPA: hypothetical protein VGO90_16640 [Chthoniobacteraceae bacterium]|nr:hypothetical protein [Chthoniobacteraceae bacterium]
MNQTAAELTGRDPFAMNPIIWIAVLLLIAWIVLRVALAVTGAALHLLWVVGLIMLAVWAVGKLRGKRTP